MKRFLKQDSFLLGLAIGIMAPWALYGLFYLIFNIALGNILLGISFLLKQSTLQLLSIVINLLAMRYYMVNLKYEKTGKGFLLITFIYIIAFFANEYLVK